MNLLFGIVVADRIVSVLAANYIVAATAAAAAATAALAALGIALFAFDRTQTVDGCLGVVEISGFVFGLRRLRGGKRCGSCSGCGPGAGLNDIVGWQGCVLLGIVAPVATTTASVATA